MTDPGRLVDRAEHLRNTAARLVELADAASLRAGQAYEAELTAAVELRLATMPIETLRAATGGRLRLGVLESEGVVTVGAARSLGLRRLDAVPGIGPKTATQVVAAADQLAASLRDATRVRFDVQARPAGQTALLEALREVERANAAVGSDRSNLERLVVDIDAHLDEARLAARPIRRFLAGPGRRRQAATALDALADVVQRAQDAGLTDRISQAERNLASDEGVPLGPWEDYLARPVAYNGLLIDVGGLGAADEAVHGFLPDEIVTTIDRFELDTSLLKVSLRGYQAFGAKFALTQQRVILGDEMGLGKTIEALAVMAHLAAKAPPGRPTRFLVICPASVLANWEHEIQRHTNLGAHMAGRILRLHGSERDRRLAEWKTSGGVALTTFGTVRALPPPYEPIDGVIVDEAHYIKNPDAKRTMAVRSWLDQSDTVLLMTGTPMENRVDEFLTLVEHLRPRLASAIDPTAGAAGADAFRLAVAPVYLRRNQEDVLDELPPLIETDEWLTLEGPSARSYRSAVKAGNFMAMRRAAFATDRPSDSPKLVRLLELVDEAITNDRKVVVFSYFLDVIDMVHRAIGSVGGGDLAYGPLTGGVKPDDRQRIIDEFTVRSGPAVLICQIEVGGVGLNLQTASVVVITEPQWKPSIEEQAIARCHRMGQVRPVEVHRLLTEDSVDEAMIAILDQKSELFARYARPSSLKEASLAAVDISDQEAVASLTDRLADRGNGDTTREQWIITTERSRLGIDDY